MSLIEILILAIIQGAAELLPVSSSAHVILAEKWMGIDPSSPEATFLLVMLHTGTMFAVLLYFRKRWKSAIATHGWVGSAKLIGIATVATAILGFGLKALIEKVFLDRAGHDKAEIEHLFKNLPLMAGALAAAGVLILIAGRAAPATREIETRSATLIGLVQGLCLPFRGFSRSGATISTGLLVGIDKDRAEDFSFALAVVLTPPVVARELMRLVEHHEVKPALFAPGLLGMVFSFASGWIALKLLHTLLEKGRWWWFGVYCLAFACVVLGSSFVLH